MQKRSYLNNFNNHVTVFFESYCTRVRIWGTNKSSDVSLEMQANIAAMQALLKPVTKHSIRGGDTASGNDIVGKWIEVTYLEKRN